MPSRTPTIEDSDLDFAMDRIASNLVQQDDGIWVSGKRTAVSYPEEGHDLCFDVEAGSFWYLHRNDVILRVMRQFPPNGAVFDIGGGNGFVSSALRDAGMSIVLVEPGIAGARNARKRGLDPVVCASIDEAGFAPSSIPAIGLFDVVEHVEDDAGFLKNLHALLKPGARLYVTVPALSWLWSVEDVRAGHFRRYTRASIEGVLRSCGFAIEFSTYFFGFLVWPLFLRRSIPSKLGLRSETSDEYLHEHAPPSPRIQKMLNSWSRAELERLDQGATLRRGTSCLVVARAER